MIVEINKEEDGRSFLFRTTIAKDIPAGRKLGTLHITRDDEVALRVEGEWYTITARNLGIAIYEQVCKNKTIPRKSIEEEFIASGDPGLIAIVEAQKKIDERKASDFYR